MSIRPSPLSHVSIQKDRGRYSGTWEKARCGGGAEDRPEGTRATADTIFQLPMGVGMRGSRSGLFGRVDAPAKRDIFDVAAWSPIYRPTEVSYDFIL